MSERSESDLFLRNRDPPSLLLVLKPSQLPMSIGATMLERERERERERQRKERPLDNQAITILCTLLHRLHVYMYMYSLYCIVLLWQVHNITLIVLASILWASSLYRKMHIPWVKITSDKGNCKPLLNVTMSCVHYPLRRGVSLVLQSLGRRFIWSNGEESVLVVNKYSHKVSTDVGRLYQQLRVRGLKKKERKKERRWTFS